MLLIYLFISISCCRSQEFILWR